MATIQSNGQSYLETEGMEARDTQTSLSDYNANNAYSETHKDALSDGDAQGKGTGDFGGHGHTVPDMTKPKTQMAYGNFNTSAGGNDCDVKARNVMFSRSIYSSDKQYGVDIVPNTSANVADGQYDGNTRSRIGHVCPVG